MNHPKTDDLRKRWIEYISELNRMRWNILPNTPTSKKFTNAFTALMQIAQGIKSTAEVEEGDTVTNGNETFIVQKVEEDRAYCSETQFYHISELRIKSKFDDKISA